MRKLEIHVFGDRTSGSKNYRLSLLHIILVPVAILLAIAGFVLFSPMQIIDNVSNEDVVSVYRQNKVIKKEIKGIRETVDESILRAEETKLLRDSTLKLSGLGFALDDFGGEETVPFSSRKSLREIEKSFKNLLNSVEKDSTLAAALPVIHPLKNGHAVRNRFEMIRDPFTEIELPHRGIDFVADVDDTVYATGAGVVSEVRAHRGFGLSVKISHLPKVRTFYAHLGHALVHEGDRVRRGDPIATISESGRESGIGLHYEIRVDGVPVNPEDYFITR
ncbi:M23 family metallopeptidase [Fibrobacter sp. UWR2]|uniref:M23 family metallopeptidase n=1 Tax=Fibrobacter sp. UWR2 TaxID=1964352 RepID=UPI000B528599|nr:M23 family metallopeptidase [Fibrobacter sp. UWR2]OWU98597.1 peptidase M23 [Fibrobacter sp. UWR2]